MNRRAGQSLIETCLAVFMICMILFGLLQISQLFAAKEILNHAAARAARAKTVGFNKFMVTKCARVALIPNAGKLTTPDFTNEDLKLRAITAGARAGEVWDEIVATDTQSALQHEVERVRIPFYLGAETWAEADELLEYEDWDRPSVTYPSLDPDDPILRVRVRQDYALRIPLHRTFYGGDEIRMEGRCDVEKHFDLYIEDEYW